MPALSPEQQRERLAGLRVHIGTPAYNGLTTSGYTLSLLQTIDALRPVGTGVAVTLIPNEALLSRARAHIAARFMADPEATHLIFIDADLQWPSYAVGRLLLRDRGVVGAAYPKKTINWPAVEAAAREGGRPLRDAACVYPVNRLEGRPPPEDAEEVVEVRNVGGGFMMLRRDVLQGLQDAHPELRFRNLPEVRRSFGLPEFAYGLFDPLYDPETGYYLTEDYSFCLRHRNAGGRVCLDRTIPLAHTGPYTFQNSAGVAEFGEG